MKTMTFLLLVLSLAGLPVSGVGQVTPAPQGNSLGNEAVPQGPTPRTPDGRVDLSGVWDPGFGFSNIGDVPLQPWAEEVLAERRANLGRDDPQARCLPRGVPRLSPFPQKFVQTPDLIVILDEGNVHSYRQLFLDGREHAVDTFPLWMGDSIGHWEGDDTLVVETIGFNDKTWLNGRGYPHTEQLRVVERFTRPELGRLVVEITLEDPGAFTGPHTFIREFTLLTDWEIHEYVCNEFNVDINHLVGQ